MKSVREIRVRTKLSKEDLGNEVSKGDFEKFWLGNLENCIHVQGYVRAWESLRGLQPLTCGWLKLEAESES